MRMSIRTDLALESAQRVSLTGNLGGVSQERRSYASAELDVTEITVETDKAQQLLGKPKGRYITVESRSGAFSSYSDKFTERVGALAGELAALHEIPDRVLVAGLGNRNITPDSLGPRTAARIFATRHIKMLAKDLDTEDMREVSVLTTGVMAQTGIESSEAVKAVCDRVKPQLVIVVDALACSQLSHLGTTVQLCDTGISPGSGVENARRELSQSTLGAPCIAVGVPTVADAQALADAADSEDFARDFPGLIVTPKSIDDLIWRTSLMIAAAINKALHPSLTQEEIDSLIL